MADFRLEDLWNIVLALGLLALFVFGSAIVYAAMLKCGPALLDYFFERASNRPLGDMLHAMSSTNAHIEQSESVVTPVTTTSTAAIQPIVTPNNEYNGKLSDNERRDFETTARNIAVMYEKGVVTNLSKAICAAYGCSVQSATKPQSTYQMAVKEINKHLVKNKGPQFPALDENKQQVLN